MDPARTLKQTIVHGKFDNCLPIVAWRLAYTPPSRERKAVNNNNNNNNDTSDDSRGRSKMRPNSNKETHLGANMNPSKRSASPRNPSPAPPSRLPPPPPTRATPSPSPPGSPTAPIKVSTKAAASNESFVFTNKDGKKTDTTMTSNTTKTYQMYQKNPILAIAASMTIQLVEIHATNDRQLQQTRDTSLIRVRGVGQVQLDDIIVGMKWLNEQVL